MIYGYELPVEMPTMDIYSTDLMKAYIAGVKEQYDDAKEDVTNFMKLYQDFYSPIAGDNDRYYNLTLGGAKDLMDLIYAQGGDPLRNPEARALILKYIYSRPTNELAKMQQSAENAKEYLKNMADLKSKGLYNPEFENWRLGGKTLGSWDSTKDGIWSETSPSQFLNLHDYTDDWFKHLEKKFNPELTKEKNDGFDYYTVDDNDLNNVIDGKLNDIKQDGGQGQYLYEQYLKQANGDPNLADQLFKNDIVSRNSDYYRLEREKNPFVEEEIRFKHDAAIARMRGGGGGGGGGDQYTLPYFTDLNLEGLNKNQSYVQITGADGKIYTTTNAQYVVDKAKNNLESEYKGVNTKLSTKYARDRRPLSIFTKFKDDDDVKNAMEVNYARDVIKGIRFQSSPAAFTTYYATGKRKTNSSGGITLNSQVDAQYMYTDKELVDMMKENKVNLHTDRKRSIGEIASFIKPKTNNKGKSVFRYANSTSRAVQIWDKNTGRFRLFEEVMVTAAGEKPRQYYMEYPNAEFAITDDGKIDFVAGVAKYPEDGKSTSMYSNKEDKNFNTTQEVY